MRLQIAIVIFSLVADCAVAQTEPGPSANTTPGQPESCNRQATYYPPAAVRDGREGTTVLAYRIGIDGRTHDVTIALSSGSPDLDQAAMEGAKCWRYKPAIKDGHPVEVDWTAKVNWKLTQPKSFLDQLFGK
jgi:protein TonB